MQEIRTRSPGLNAVTAGPTAIDNADAFVAENAARLAARDIALENMQIGAANRRLGDFDDRVGRRRMSGFGHSCKAFFSTDCPR